MSSRELLDLFRAAAQYYDLRGDEWRARAYATAADTLASVDVMGAPLADLAAMRGIGKSILGLIEEYRNTGTIACIASLLTSPEYKSWEMLSRVTGAGPATVSKWIAAGLHTPNEVLRAARKGRIKITSMQEIGLTYYDDLCARIPRAEVELIVAIVGCCAREVAPSVRIVPAGSYRRGKPDSGDVDILVVARRTAGGSLLEDILSRVELSRPCIRIIVGEARVSFLIKPVDEKINRGGKISDGTNAGHTGSNAGHTGSNAGHSISNYWRQVDLLLVRPENYWASLLYFTGGAEHVRGIRAICQARGMRLNQDGLFKAVMTSVKYPNGLMPVPLTSERDLYDILAIDYVPPEYR